MNPEQLSNAKKGDEMYEDTQSSLPTRNKNEEELKKDMAAVAKKKTKLCYAPLSVSSSSIDSAQAQEVRPDEVVSSPERPINRGTTSITSPSRSTTMIGAFRVPNYIRRNKRNSSRTNDDFTLRTTTMIGAFRVPNYLRRSKRDSLSAIETKNIKNDEAKNLSYAPPEKITERRRNTNDFETISPVKKDGKQLEYGTSFANSEVRRKVCGQSSNEDIEMPTNPGHTRLEYTSPYQEEKAEVNFEVFQEPPYEEEKNEVDIEMIEEVEPGAYHVPGIDFIGVNELSSESRRQNWQTLDLPYEVEAMLVRAENEEVQHVPEAILVDKEAEKKEQNRSKRKKVYTIIFVLMIFVAIITYFTKQERETVEDQIDKIITLQFPRSEHMTSADTPQHEAFDWLIKSYKSIKRVSNKKILAQFGLSVLYFSTNTADWIDRKNWVRLTEECSWFGIECGGNGEVIGIDLSNNNLDQVIPSEITAMTELNRLNFAFNKLTGILPGIGLQERLTSLNLRSNRLAMLPSEIFVDLKNINFLDLGENKLTSIPTEIGILQNLVMLDFSANNLKRVPSELGLLQSLTSLNLSNNALTSLPSEIGLLENLSSFWFHGNEFTDPLPIDVQDFMPQYQKLALSTIYDKTGGNSWRNKQSWLESDKECDWYGVSCNENHEVIKLELPKNNLIGIVPEEIRFLGNLIVLDLSRNELDYIPHKYGLLQNLSSVDLEYNNLISLPTEIGLLNKLSRLSLSKNDLTNLPSEIGKLEKLSSFWLHGNQFTDPPPTEVLGGNNWNKKQNWTNFDKESNWYGVSFNEHSEVVGLKLPNNALVGNVSEEVTLLESLIDLDLSGNKLKTITSELGLLQSLTSLNLKSNGLKNIPSELCILQNLAKFDLSANKLIVIPSELGLLQSLTSFELNNNYLQWVPSEIGLLQSLSSLNFKNNILLSLPKEIGQLENLSSFWYYGNRLTDPLPREIKELIEKNKGLSQQHALLTLYNGMKGNSWNEKKNWFDLDKECNWYGVSCNNNSAVIKLELPNNNLSGSLPEEISLLEDITVLDLSENRLENGNSLTGRIPTQVTELIKTNHGINESKTIISNVPVSDKVIFQYGTAQYRAFNNITYRMQQDGIVLDPIDLVQKYILATLYFSTNNSDGWRQDENDDWLILKDRCNWDGVRECNANREVTNFILWNKNLNGTLPKEIGWMSKLTFLALYNNNLHGSITSEIGQLTDLEYLYLEDNKLTGSIPSELGLLTNINDLSLRENELIGTVPNQLLNLKGLQVNPQCISFLNTTLCNVTLDSS